MPEMTKRPKIRELKFTIQEGRNERQVKGPDFNDVLRGIVIDLRNAWGLSTRALSFRLGVRQQTLAGFIDQDLDQGTRLDTLSHICAALDMTIDEMFALHPNYKTSASHERGWAMVRNSLDPESVKLFIEAVLIGSQIGVLPSLIKNLHQMTVSLAESQGIDTAGAAKEAKAIANF